MKPTPSTTTEKELIKVFEAAGLVEFIEYLHSGKRLMWLNFKAGVAKGFGVTVGMTVVLGVLIWILTLLVDLPIVGEYFLQAEEVITEYAESTNYKEDFAEMNGYLREINESVQLGAEVGDEPLAEDTETGSVPEVQ